MVAAKDRIRNEQVGIHSQKVLMLRIRAHHFLCMQGFQGYGYNLEFTDNIQRIIEEIKSAPDLRAEIISRCDEICSCCPHNMGGVCQKKPCSEEEIKDMDLSVMRHLDIEEGSRMKVKSIFNPDFSIELKNLPERPHI